MGRGAGAEDHAELGLPRDLGFEAPVAGVIVSNPN